MNPLIHLLQKIGLCLLIKESFRDGFSHGLDFHIDDIPFEKGLQDFQKKTIQITK